MNVRWSQTWVEILATLIIHFAISYSCKEFILAIKPPELVPKALKLNKIQYFLSSQGKLAAYCLIYIIA